LPINQSSSPRSQTSATDWLGDLLPVWGLAVALSAALVAAGERWPQPLTPDGRWVGVLVFGLPLLMGIALVAGWLFRAPAGDTDRGESGD
jgi:hypothetical protein